jgi:hypothetical protein
VRYRDVYARGFPFREDASGVIHATFYPVSDWPRLLTECECKCVASIDCAEEVEYANLVGIFLGEATPVTCLACLAARPDVEDA